MSVVVRQCQRTVASFERQRLNLEPMFVVFGVVSTTEHQGSSRRVPEFRRHPSRLEPAPLAKMRPDQRTPARPETSDMEFPDPTIDVTGQYDGPNPLDDRPLRSHGLLWERKRVYSRFNENLPLFFSIRPALFNLCIV